MKHIDSFFFLSGKKFFFKRFFLAQKTPHLVLFFSFFKRLPVSFLEFAHLKALIFRGVFSSSFPLTKICSGHTLLISFPKNEVIGFKSQNYFLLLALLYKKKLLPASFIRWFYLFSDCSSFSQFFRFLFFIFYLSDSNRIFF